MKFLRLAIIFLTLAPWYTGAAESPGSETEWQFDVFLGDKEIGYHRFSATALDNAWLVQNEADFEVRFLFIKAFEYEHNNSEVWRDGCLRSIDARTNANGKRLAVLGQQREDGFVLESESGQQAVDDCVASFAYWDRELLQRNRLLNAQTGEYLPVELKQLPDDRLEIGSQFFEVERLHLSAKDLDIIVSYDVASGQWLGLESTLKNGRTLLYKRNADYLPQTDPQRVAASRKGSLIGEVRN